MKKLQKKINYQFKDLSLLKLALTHRSTGRNNNERLEFLGDSILGVAISKELYQRFPCVDEGKLSRLRSHLIRGQTLVQLGTALELSNNLILGSGELKSGGYRRESIQADTVEAIFGAVLLDSNFETTNMVILGLFKVLLNSISPDDSLKDSKTQLQEYLQKRGNILPKYKLIDTTGKDHNAIFMVNCFLEDQKLQVKQSAKSIKKAEQFCAQILLKKLKKS
ncbi:ribonuclease III [Candidatus Vesicomyidisocius calyptogenae]|uniref:Ribonuclease 3 n=1 Tax=Vesicomyosocius okutanii subsp. Calyptogena okutanii (strain HA) TaxID=412965 RepID=A5CWK1_VESOH|nr:ribonuclease III [Candidatus Vesicomyosocius okutanii]BAF61683.1 ribonuclease III [Candidatus Vesicomyosocius okutanii]